MFTRIASAVLFAVAMTAPISSASAHPKLLSATPSVDGHVASTPASLSLTFNEAITSALSSLTLLDAAQQSVKLESVHNDAKNAATVIAKISGHMAPGRYTVKWQAAGKDGHPMKGEFSFIVDAAK